MFLLKLDLPMKADVDVASLSWPHHPKLSSGFKARGCQTLQASLACWGAKRGAGEAMPQPQVRGAWVPTLTECLKSHSQRWEGDLAP